MQNVIENNYTKETKVTGAVISRAPNSTLIDGKDKLNLVYDTYINLKQEKGKCKVNILFLHGSGMNRTIWEYYVAYILRYQNNWTINKIILLDQTTHGDSSLLNSNKLGCNFDWVDGARDGCKVALEEFGIKYETQKSDEGVINIVVGHSMGGHQALACGVLFPYLFDTIIAIEPVLIVNEHQGKGPRLKLPYNFYKALWPKLQDTFKSDAAYHKHMKTSSVYIKVKPEILERVMDFERQVASDGTITTKMSQTQNMLCYLTLENSREWLINGLKQIKVPVHGIVGEISKWTPPLNQETIEKELPNYIKETIPQGDHLVNLELPDLVLESIGRHISKFVMKHTTGTHVQSLTLEHRYKKYNSDYQAMQLDMINGFRSGQAKL